MSKKLVLKEICSDSEESGASDSEVSTNSDASSVTNEDDDSEELESNVSETESKSESDVSSVSGSEKSSGDESDLNSDVEEESENEKEEKMESQTKLDFSDTDESDAEIDYGELDAIINSKKRKGTNDGSKKEDEQQNKKIKFDEKIKKATIPKETKCSSILKQVEKSPAPINNSELLSSTTFQKSMFKNDKSNNINDLSTTSTESSSTPENEKQKEKPVALKKSSSAKPQAQGGEKFHIGKSQQSAIFVPEFVWKNLKSTNGNVEFSLKNAPFKINTKSILTTLVNAQKNPENNLNVDLTAYIMKWINKLSVLSKCKVTYLRAYADELLSYDKKIDLAVDTMLSHNRKNGKQFDASKIPTPSPLAFSLETLENLLYPNWNEMISEMNQIQHVNKTPQIVTYLIASYFKNAKMLRKIEKYYVLIRNLGDLIQRRHKIKVF